MDDLRNGIRELREDMNRQFADVNRQFADRHFTWLIRIQVTTILTMVGLFARAYVR